MTTISLYLTCYQTLKYKKVVSVTKWSWNHEADAILSGKDWQTCCPRGILVYLSYFCFLLLKLAKTQYPCPWLVTELLVEWVQQLNSLSKALEKKITAWNWYLHSALKYWRKVKISNKLTYTQQFVPLLEKSEHFQLLLGIHKQAIKEKSYIKNSIFNVLLKAQY